MKKKKKKKQKERLVGQELMRDGAEECGELRPGRGWAKRLSRRAARASTEKGFSPLNKKKERKKERKEEGRKETPAIASFPTFIAAGTGEEQE